MLSDTSLIALAEATAMNHSIQSVAYAVPLTLLAACGGGSGGSGGGGEGSSNELTLPDMEPTLSSIQTELFTPTCAVSGCHTGGSPAEDLDLSDGQSFANLVGVNSSQAAATLRVDPGNPNGSYLITKLEGTQLIGSQMPRGGPPLSAEAIDVIRQWITDGAMNNSITLTRVAGVAAVIPSDGRVLDEAPNQLAIAFDQALDASLVMPGTVVLTASGGDGDFSTGNESTIIPEKIVVSESNPGLITVDLEPLGLKADSYRAAIEVDGDIPLTTIDGELVDGDGDGIPGGDFVSEFTVQGADA